jgi:hypothetical protein
VSAATPGQADDAVTAGLEARQRAREAADLMRAAMAASDAHSAVGTDDWPAWEAAAKAAHEVLAAAQEPHAADGTARRNAEYERYAYGDPGVQL